MWLCHVSWISPCSIRMPLIFFCTFRSRVVASSIAIPSLAPVERLPPAWPLRKLLPGHFESPSAKVQKSCFPVPWHFPTTPSFPLHLLVHDLHVRGATEDWRRSRVLPSDPDTKKTPIFLCQGVVKEVFCYALGWQLFWRLPAPDLQHR